MNSNLTLFQEKTDQFIESIFSDITPSSLRVLSTLQLNDKNTYYLLDDLKKNKYRFSLSSSKQDLYPGWNEYELDCLDKEKNLISVLNCDPSSLKEIAKERMKEYMESISAVKETTGIDGSSVEVHKDLAPATRYVVDSDSNIDVGISTFGTRSFYEFKLENISKTGMLVSSSYKTLPFSVSTLVEINITFANDTKLKKLEDVNTIGKITKIMEKEVEEGKIKKFVGVSISQSADIETWENLISTFYIK